MIPILNEYYSSELLTGKTPEVVIDKFFKKHTVFKTETEKHAFLFKIIQYTERQVVLIDAIEDAFFSKINNVRGDGSIDSIFNNLADPDLSIKKIEKKT